ncbi:RDD family protein [Methanobacterium formicicum]|uniref:RDD domain-containing protein n=1 Tax=Methanobacterium formicicum (strain DSM 3637 / PP1) TaxID=1204725 RepID=K2RSA0_METFP|nr:RDD family protein [Methanobacterium formicicum]EKF85660.1 RDD domain-containing protein [Methanobacterium formicicum DSM 3637]
MQEFWGRRLVALIVDVIFITLLMWVLTAIVYPVLAWNNLYSVLNYWLVLLGVLIVLYFTVMEGKWSSTLGKGLLKLKVQAADGNMNCKKAFLRNISKFLWVPLVIDLLIGVVVSKEGTRQRYLDILAKTTVIKVE